MEIELCYELVHTIVSGSCFQIEFFVSSLRVISLREVSKVKVSHSILLSDFTAKFLLQFILSADKWFVAPSVDRVQWQPR